MPNKDGRAAIPPSAGRAWRLLWLASVLSGAGFAQPPLQVVATTAMVGDVAKAVAGECAVVVTLMGPGTDPHLYRASASDVAALAAADVILYSGLGLEGRLATALTELGKRVTTAAVAELAVPEGERLVHPSGVTDPHAWLSAAAWAGTARVIAELLAAELTARAPDGASDCVEGLAERAATYEQRVLALHDWAKATLASVPRERRVLVTAHDAFHYFGRAYDVEVVGIQGLSTDSEAAVADVRRVADVVVTRGVGALFVESTIDPRTVLAVLDAVASRGGTAVLGPELYGDAMGVEGSSAGTYLGMLVSNVTVITRALGGEVLPLPTSVAEWVTILPAASSGEGAK